MSSDQVQDRLQLWRPVMDARKCPHPTLIDVWTVRCAYRNPAGPTVACFEEGILASVRFAQGNLVVVVVCRAAPVAKELTLCALSDQRNDIKLDHLAFLIFQRVSQCVSQQRLGCSDKFLKLFSHAVRLPLLSLKARFFALTERPW